MQYFYTVNFFGNVNWVLEATDEPWYFTRDGLVTDLLVVLSRYELKELHATDAFLEQLKANLENSDTFGIWCNAYKRNPENIQTRCLFRKLLTDIVGNTIENAKQEQI